jgi:flagellar biosynthesis/type III secretory pathway M-ring protein FliF/YscJ
LFEFAHFGDGMLANDSETSTNADEKRKQKEHLQKLVTAQTKETANLIKSWLEKQKSKPTRAIGTRGKIE